MRVLFDQPTPWPLRAFLPGHSVSSAAHENWSRLQNGALLDAAEAAGFEVLVTTDQNLHHQQNLKNRKIAVVVLGRQQWPLLRLHVDKVRAAVNAATPGTYTFVDIP